ncbi:MAG: polysaccharide deacetylase family protein [Deferribacteres bacterium]|nr:polysaccharide deacetylase family protein [Deferribacteres bacterium]
MFSTYAHKLRWSYRKNWPDIQGILLKKYPDFVFNSSPSSLENQVPVFVFHSVDPITFEEQLLYLKKNGYRTLNADDLLQILKGKKTLQERSVVLTFDDGVASLYSVAWPLLKKYEYQAISFLIPGCITDEAPPSASFDDYLSGQVPFEKLLEREQGDFPLCSWQEINEIHQSGEIDFQAHTMYHHLVNIQPQVVDYINPNFDFYFYANVHVPVFYEDGKPNYARDVAVGTPVYRAEPRMSAVPQYFDNEDVRKACVEFVNKKGRASFFMKVDWRKQLSKFYTKQVEKYGLGTFEGQEEMRQDILWDFETCKSEIEKNVHGKKVEHFCFPWFIGSETAIELARQAGFRSLYWGVLPDRKCNSPHDNPLRIVRIEDRFLHLLPGDGRRTLPQVVSEKVSKYLPIFKKRLQNAK